MTFQDIIQRLEKHISFVNKAIVGTAIIEAVLVIIIGIISNNLNTENATVNQIAIWLLIFFGLLYLFLLFIKTIYNKTFPGSITNELKSERELSVLKRDAERQKTINDFLVTVIQRLNGQTCALNYGDDIHLCDTGIKEGIYNLIQPVVDNTYFILDTINTQFTTGIYLDNYRSLAADNLWEKGIIIISDDFGKEALIEKDLLEQANVRDEQFFIQTAIRQSFNNSVFVKQDYLANEQNFSIVCGPMPFACDENETNGVFFIISKEIDNVPVDTEINLKIFNSVIANWVYRYNDCINNRQERSALQTQALPLTNNGS